MVPGAAVCVPALFLRLEFLSLILLHSVFGTSWGAGAALGDCRVIVFSAGTSEVRTQIRSISWGGWGLPGPPTTKSTRRSREGLCWVGDWDVCSDCRLASKQLRRRGPVGDVMAAPVRLSGLTTFLVASWVG